DRRDLLYFEVVIAAAESAHLFALALPGERRHVARPGVRHLPALLDSLEVHGGAVAALDRPLRAARQHGVHLLVVEADGAGAAEARRNAARKLVGERLLHRTNVLSPQARMRAAHAAGDVEAHAAGRDHAAFAGIERGNPADRKAVAPVRIQIGRAHV